VFALADRCYSIAGIGLIALANIAALAVIAMAAVDRYGSPFKPLIAVVAVYAMVRITGRQRRREAPTAACAEAGGG